MQFGSAYPGLFSSNGHDPRNFVGTANARRCIAPANNTLSASGHARSQSQQGQRSTSSASGDGRPTSVASTSKSNSPSRVINGMRLPATEGSHSGGGGQLSLLTLDPELTHAPDAVLLDSPRSIAACLRLGVTPFDMLVPTFDEMLLDMKRRYEEISDEHVTELRYNYLCKRARQKLKLATDERNSIIFEEAAGDGGGGHRGAAQSDADGSFASGGGGSGSAAAAGQSSSKIQEEERRLQKIVANNKSRLWQQLLHSELMQKKREREDERIKATRVATENQRKQRVQELIEKSRKDEEAQALRNEARELERREQQARSELKRALYDAKDKQVKERIVQQQIEAEAENEAKRQLNAERRAQMKVQAEQVLRDRRTEFERRNELFELAREEFQRKLEYKKEERASIAKFKKIKIAEAIQRSEEQLAAKIHKTLEKERVAEIHRQENEVKLQEELRHKAEEERDMAEKRRRVLLEAQDRERRRIEQLVATMSAEEVRIQKMEEQRDAEHRVNVELEYQKELDKLDCVERSKRIEEHRIEQLVAIQAEKRERIEAMYLQQEELKKKRKEHREEAERSRVKIVESTPGPLDFVPLNKTIAENEEPKWKFGLPASTMGLRVVMRNAPAPAYSVSPGPCIYRHEICEDARHRKTAAFSMSKHDRWVQQSDVLATPGPQDYAPQTPSPIRVRPSSSMM